MWHIFHTHGLIKVKLTSSLFSASESTWQPVVSLGNFQTDDYFCFAQDQRRFVTEIKWCHWVLGLSAAQNTPKAMQNWHKKWWKGEKEIQARPEVCKELGHFTRRIAQIEVSEQGLDYRQRWIHTDFLEYSHELCLPASQSFRQFF